MILSSESHGVEHSADAFSLQKEGTQYADDAMPLEKNAGLIMAVGEPCLYP